MKAIKESGSCNWDVEIFAVRDKRGGGTAQVLTDQKEDLFYSPVKREDRSEYVPSHTYLATDYARWIHK